VTNQLFQRVILGCGWPAEALELLGNGSMFKAFSKGLKECQDFSRPCLDGPRRVECELGCKDYRQGTSISRRRGSARGNRGKRSL